MDDFIQKFRAGTLTDQEVDKLYNHLGIALVILREKDPRKYVELLTNLQEVLGRLIVTLKTP